jgi:hypothetical protein
MRSDTHTPKGTFLVIFERNSRMNADTQRQIGLTEIGAYIPQGDQVDPQALVLARKCTTH